MATRIVDQAIKRLKAPDANHCIEWDSEIPGFGVRITAAGVISFILDYRIHGRHRRYTIGRYPDEYSATAARTRAGELRQRIREGRDPMEERNQSRLEPTLGDLVTEYLESEAELKKRPRTVREDKRMVEKFIRPKLGSYRLKGIGSRDVERAARFAQGHPIPGQPGVGAALGNIQLCAQGKVDHGEPRQGSEEIQRREA